jgi:hypothetical protein
VPYLEPSRERGRRSLTKPGPLWLLAAQSHLVVAARSGLAPLQECRLSARHESRSSRASVVGFRHLWHAGALRRGVVLIVLSFVLPSSAAAHERGAFWPTAKAMQAVDDARVRVGSKVVRVKVETTLCSGEGRVMRLRGLRAWKHFRCRFTILSASGEIGRDLEFRVHPLDVRRISITDASWIVG